MEEMSADSILVARQAPKSGNVSALVAEIARAEGVAPFRMMREIMMMKRAPSHMSEQEYFDFRIHDPALSKDEKRAFLGAQGSYRLNLKLSPPELTHMRGLIWDKVAFGAVLHQFGLPAAETQALVTRHRRMGRLPCLRNTDDIVHFLREVAVYPLFGKPTRGLQALGTVGIDRLDRVADRLHLADGGAVAVAELAAEIMRDFPDGYMFQTRVAQHPQIAAQTGAAVGTVRLVTVIEEDTPRVLYAIWKIPASGAMSDNFWQKGSILCRLDHDTGEVQAARAGKGTETRWLDRHPDTGLVFKGFRIPNWERVAGLAVDAHALFPVNGMLGWDIAVGPEGGVVIECNANPGHEFYQLSTGRGANGPEMRAVFDRVIARNKRLFDELKGKY